MRSASNIVFDIGNVILDLDIPGAHARISELCDPSITKEAFLALITPVVHEFEIGAIGARQFIEAILRHAKEEVTGEEIVEAWNSILSTLPVYRLGMLTSLRENFTLIVLSNTNPLHLTRLHTYLKSAHGIHDFEKQYFDDVYYSCEIHARKPSSQAFQYVIDDALITPARTLFIDDDPENIAIAETMGFQTMHCPADAEVAERLKVLGYY